MATLGTAAYGQSYSTYSSLIDFQNASSGLLLEDFSSQTPGNFVEGVASDLGDFSVLWVDGVGSSGMAAYIAPDPYAGAEHAPFTTSQYLGWSESGPFSAGSGTAGPTVTLTFDSPITAVGFDFLDSDDTDAYSLAVDGNAITGLFAGDGVGFFGVTSDTAFTTLTFTSVVQGGLVEPFGLDNLAYGLNGQVVWTSPTDGNWEDGANWSTGLPPGASSDVLLDGGLAVTAALNGPATIESLTATDSGMSVDLGTQTLGITANLIVGEAGEPIGDLTLTGTPGSGLLEMTGISGALRVGRSTTAAGQADKLTIDGVEVVLNGTSYLNVGAAGNGRVEVVNGGKITDASYIEVADGTTASDTQQGYLLVSGAGSMVTSNGRFTVGDGTGSASNDNIYGELSVLEGGAVSADYLAAGTWFGTGANPARGLITIGSTTANDSTAIANNLVLGGHLSASTGALIEGGEGDIVINTGGVVTVADTVYIVDANDSIDIDGGTLTGGTLLHAGNLTVQDGGAATFNAVGVFHKLGTPGNDASTTVDGGTLHFLNNNRLQVGTSGGSDSNLDIVNGGIVHSDGEVRLADDSNSNGTLNVDGPGSKFTSNAGLIAGDGGNNGDIFLSNQGHLELGGNLITANSPPPKSSFVWIQSDASMTVNGTGTSGIGYSGLGTMWVDGGSFELTSSDRLSVGHDSGSSGNLLIMNGGVVTLNNDLFIGDLPSAFGSVTAYDPGSTLTVGGDLVLADASNAKGTLSIETGTTVSVGGDIYLGFAGNGDATLNLDGGTLNLQNGDILSDGENARALYFLSGSLDNPGTISDDALFQQTGILNRDIAGNTLIDAAHRFYRGEMNVSAGTLEVTGTMRTGADNAGGNQATVTVSGTGTFRTRNLAVIGRDSDDTGQWDISGGLVEINTIGSATGPALGLARRGGTAVIDQTGGDVRLYNDDLQLGADAGYSGGSATYNLSGGTLDLNGNDIVDGPGGGTAVFNFTGGTLADAGTINLGGTFTQAGGTLAPGSSPGTTAIVGDFDFNAGTLAMELAGATTPGTDHDQVTVTGNFHAAGDLDVSLIGTYIPTDGDAFDLFDFASTSGSFANINLPSLGGVLIWDTTSLLTTGELLVGSLASDFHWDNPAGGSWQNDSNWATDLKPATVSTPVFDLNQSSAYTVTLAQDETVAALDIRTDKVILDAAASQMLSVDGPVRIGDLTGESAELTIAPHVTLVADDDIQIGTQGGTADITIRGNLDAWDTVARDVIVGSGGSITIDGGEVRADRLDAGDAAAFTFNSGKVIAQDLIGPPGLFIIGGDPDADAPAEVEIEFGGNLFASIGALAVGNDGGWGEVTISGAASLDSSTWVGNETSASGQRSRGKLVVDGSGSVNGNVLAIGRDGGDGLLEVRGDTRLLSIGDLFGGDKLLIGSRFNRNGSPYTVRGVGVAAVMDGAELRIRGNAVVGNSGGQGTLTVDGPESLVRLDSLLIGAGADTFSAPSPVFQAVAGFGEGEVFVTNGGTIDGLFELSTPGRLLEVSADYNSGGTSRIVVDGAGSTILFDDAVIGDGGGQWYTDDGSGGFIQQTFTSTGIMDITNGGAAIFAGKIEVARNTDDPAYSRGEIAVSGAGSLLEALNDGTPPIQGELNGGPGHLFLGGKRNPAGTGTDPGGTGILSIANGGTVSLGHTFWLIDSADTAINLDGGTLRAAYFDNGGNLNRLNWTSGTLDLTHTSLTVGTGSELGDNLAITAGKHLRLGGALAVDATGSLNIAGGGSVTTAGDFDPVNALSFSLQDGTLDTAQVVGNLVVGAGGTLRAHGIGGDLTANQATVEATDADGVFIVSGDLTLTGDEATLRLDLAGSLGSPGTDFEQAQVAGQAILDGNLHLTFAEGFVPQATDTFAVLTASSIIGNFNSVTGDRYDGVTPWLSRVVGGTVIVSAALPGDTDLDGDIDDSDLGTSFSNFTGPAGSTGGKTFADGDTDGDGDVDDADLANSFAGFTGPLFSPTTVPEPTSLALVGLGCLLLSRRRRCA